MGTRALGVDETYAYCGFIGNCQAAHSQPVMQGGYGAVWLMGRVPGRRQHDLVQLQLMPGLYRKDQMPNVNRIESASENADSFASQSVS